MTSCPDCAHLRERLHDVEQRLCRERVEHDRVLLAYAEKHVELLAQLEGRTAPSATFKVGDEG